MLMMIGIIIGVIVGVLPAPARFCRC
jgi:hypothetical protein